MESDPHGSSYTGSQTGRNHCRLDAVIAAAPLFRDIDHHVPVARHASSYGRPGSTRALRPCAELGTPALAGFSRSDS